MVYSQFLFSSQATSVIDMNIIQTVKSILLKLIDDHVAVDGLLNPNPSPDDVGDILNVE